MILFGVWLYFDQRSIVLCDPARHLDLPDRRRHHRSLPEAHAVLRNYPIAAHLRFIFEAIRPEMRQYFFEGEKDGMPFSRDQRAVVYQRAKSALDVRPFGTNYDVYAPGYEWINHSIAPTPVEHASRSASLIGGPECTQPYSASVFNISAMSFGSLVGQRHPRAERRRQARRLRARHRRRRLSPYHREDGGDIVWEIGSGYFGCRNADGTFSPETLRRAAPRTRRSR